MPSDATIDLLNQVLELLERSFPQYLLYAKPYIPAGKEYILQAIEGIAAGQTELAQRVSQHIFESGGLPDHGDFPIEFTDTHDLGIDFLVDEAIDCLKGDIADLEHYVDTLRLAPVAQSLALEARGQTKAHLEQLEKLKVDPGTVTLPLPQAQPAVNNH